MLTAVPEQILTSMTSTLRAGLGWGLMNPQRFAKMALKDAQDAQASPAGFGGIPQ